MKKLSWREMTAQLTDLSEDEVQKMLDQELAKHRRPAVARRLHQRLCMLRAARERTVIMQSLRA